MCKKNVKWYLKDTKNEISLGDEMTYHQTVSFSKYPNMVFETTITHPLDEEDIKTLEESEIIEKKVIEPKNWEFYLLYWANIKGLNASEVIRNFNYTCKVNRNAALSILLKAISVYTNKGKGTHTPSKVWIYNLTNGKPAIVDVTEDTKLKDIAWFTTTEELDYALRVCAPLLNPTNK